MPKFSKKSQAKLDTCHPDLVKVFEEVIKHVDCTILEGIRSLETQKEYVRKGSSKTMNSKHLKQDDGYSHAVDVSPWPIDWKDRDRFIMFAGFVRGIGKSMGIDVTSGIDWDDDFSVKDHTFFDGPHFQLRNPRQISKPVGDVLPEGPSDQEIEDKLKGLG